MYSYNSQRFYPDVIAFFVQCFLISLKRVNSLQNIAWVAGGIVFAFVRVLAALAALQLICQNFDLPIPRLFRLQEIRVG